MQAVNRVVECDLGSGRLLVINFLSGAVDILQGETLDAYRKVKLGSPIDSSCHSWLLERGYVLPDGVTEKQVMSTLLENFKVVQPRQPRFYIAPSFDCNLSCIYCNQWDLNNDCKMHRAMVVSAFDIFDRAMEDFANKSTIGVPQRPMVHLYGGEPLLPANMAIVECIFDEAKTRGYTVSVITNGVHVPDFIQLFDKYRDVVKSFLITVDGPPEVHDNRRPCKDGKGTFALVDAGISQLLEKEFKVTVQAVVDAASIPALVWLARYARSQGWLDEANCKLAAAKVMFPMCNPPPRYNMQDADDVSFIEAYLQTLSQHPDEVSLFSVPTGEIGVLQFLSRVLGSPSLIPFPQLRGCDATNGLIWALGSDGLVYCCVETIGYQSFAVGQYYPVYKADTDAIERWRSLCVRERETCLLCDWVTVCGGGCALKSLVSNRGCVCPPNQLLFETYLDNAQTLVQQVLSGPVLGGKR